ncbi:MAG: hypothetical protein ABEK50_12270 [bacterium]
MSECPVCQSPQIGSPGECRVCGTPLRRTGRDSRSTGTLLTLFLPGLGHLWRGHLLKGSLALFGSIYAILYLLVGTYGTVEFAWRTAMWGIFWLIWIGFWRWEFAGLPRRFPSASKIVSYLTIGLVLSNFLMAVIVSIAFNRVFYS